MKQISCLVLGLGFLIMTFAIRTAPFRTHAQTKPSVTEPVKVDSSVAPSTDREPGTGEPAFSDELQAAFALVESANVDEIDRTVDGAVRAAETTLKQREKDLGPDDRMVGESLLTLGLLYTADREYAKAEKALKRARTIYEKAYGSESVELSYALAASAEYEMERGVLDHAEKWLKRSLELREKAFGPEHLEVAKAVFTLAEYYQSMRQFTKANELYDRVLAIRAKLDSGDDSLNQVMARQACILRKKQKSQEAAELEFRAGVGPEPKYEWNGKYKHPEYSLLNGKLRRPAVTWLSTVSGEWSTDWVWARVAISPTGRVLYVCSNASEVPSLLSYRYERILFRSVFDPTITDNEPVMAAGSLSLRFKDSSPKAVVTPDLSGTRSIQ